MYVQRIDPRQPPFVYGWELGDREEPLSQHQLADIARKAWHKMGHEDVKVWVEQTTIGNPHGHATVIEEIRSNLVNGLPPRRAA